MKYKVIVCDLDGTLLDSDHTLLEDNKKEIKRVSELGVKVILATGRHYVDVRAVADELGLNTCIVGSNGTRVYSGNGDQLISHNHNVSAIDVVLNYKLPEDVHLNIYQGKEWLVLEDHEELLSFHKHSGFKYRKIKDISELDKSEINKFYLYSNKKESLLQVEKELKVELGDLADIFFSYFSVLEIMPKGISKGLALEELMRNEGVGSNEIMAFGDGLNDYEMLSWVGKGLVMKNADNELKKLLPNNEVIESNDDSGVAKYLRDNVK